MTHIPLSSPSLSESATAVAAHPENAVVVGIGCRFPGSATSPSRLWDMLCRRESGWSPIERFNAQGFYHPDPKRQGSIPVKGAHFLASDPASFDASFFSVPAADARSMDPQQRILLEVTYEALESAGITLDELKGSRTSVFIASFVKDYEAISLRDIDGQPDLAATGNGTAILANRISYFFDLKGPSVTIDTACSGSLVAIDLAIQSLKSGSSDMAIVGGVNMMLIPDTMIPMSSMGFLSPEGKCYTFDSRANGYGRGEGAGIVILKRLSDAVSHNDPIRAEVVGHGVNQDGRTSGITMPNAASQEMNIRDVYTRNDLCFSDTAYVECHGTGTIVGDAMEMSAISSGIRLRQPPGQSPLVIGSIKTNIGHLEGAAGVAGFIKSVLAVEHGKIPPIINFENPRQDVNAGELGLQIPLETMDWPRGYRRRQASINSFGFGGTNAHAVVADVEYLSQKAPNPVFSRSTLTTKESPQPFVFSAHGTSSLKQILSQFLAHLEEMPSADQGYLNDLAYTLGCRRSRLETRIAISASSLEHLQSQLRAADEVDFTKVNSLPPKVCFVFAGQGGVWAQMGQSLRSFQAYRESIAAANTFIQKTYHCSYNIEELLAASAEEGSQVSNVDIAQIITTTVQVACIDLLASLGVEATYVIGHSSGEIAAAYAAKKITRQFAWSCAFLRGLWVRLLLTRDPDVEGGMISAGLGVEDAEAFLNELQINRNRVVIACINSPRSVTISGRALEMSTVARELSARKIFHRVLQIPCGYHSPDMGKIEVDYVQSLYVHPQSEPFFSAAEIASAPAMYSTLLGQALDKAPLVHRYWGMNLVHQVQFQAGLEAMATSFTNSTSSSQPLIFLEVGTAGVMRTPVLDSISAHFSGKKTQPRYLSLLNMKQTSELAVIQRLGEMWSYGIDINMSKVISRSSTLFAGQLHCLVDLPSYPWNHENKYWSESHLTKSHLNRVWPRRDLVGARSMDSTPFEMKWRGFHRLAENPWMKDHKIQGAVLYPAAGMIAMVIEAASELATESASDVVSFEITNFAIHQAMVVPDDAHGLESTLSLKLSNSSTEIKYTFDIFSQVSFGPVQRNASGILTFVSASPEHGLFLNKQNARLLESFSLCNQDGSTVELYETLESIGLQYGPTFRNITDIRRKGNCSYATLRVPDTKVTMPYAFEFEHVIHPATLDSMLHALFSPESQPMVPVGIEKIVISASLRGGKAGSHFYGFGDLTSHGIRESTGDVVMALGLADQPQVVLNGIRLAALQLPEGWLAPHRNLASEIVWKEDIATLNPSDSLPCAIEDVLEALIFKNPCLSVLQIGWSVTQSPDLLIHLSTRCQRLKLTAQGHISQPLDDEFLKRSNIQHKIVDTFDKQTQLVKNYDLVIVCNQDSIDIASLQARLSSHGVMLLPGPLAKVKACLQLNQPSVDFSRAFAVSCFGDDLTLIRSPQRTGAISSPVAVLVPQDRSHDVISMAANIRSLLLQGGITTKVVVMPLENPLSIAGHQCISLCHLSRDTTVWEKKEDIEEIRRLKKSASAVLFVTQPVLGNSMFGAQITGLVRTLISEGSRVPLAVLKLSEEAELASTCISSLVRDAAAQVFGELGVCDVEFEERELRLFVPRLQLLPEVNSLIDPSLVQAVEADFFSADLQKQTVLKSRKMMSEADNLHWVQTSLPLPGPGEIVFRRFATLISSADVMQLKSRTSSSSFPFLGCDFFGADPSPSPTCVSRFEQGSSVVGLMLPQPFSSHVVANPLLVRPLPKPLSYFSLSAYVAAVAALAGSHPVMETLESFEPSSFVNGHNPGVGKSVLVIGAASVHGQAAVQVANVFGYHVLCLVDSADEADVLIRAGVSWDAIAISEKGLERLTFKRRFDVIFVAPGFVIPVSNKCRYLFQVADRDSASVAPSKPRGTIHYEWDIKQLLEEDVLFLSQMVDIVQALSYAGRLTLSYAGPIHEASSLNEAVRQREASPGHGMVVAAFEPNHRVNLTPRAEMPSLSSRITSDSFYVIAGAPRGLAGSIGRMLVNCGARRLAFLSRSAGTSVDDKKLVMELEALGAVVRVLAVDLTNCGHVAAIASTLMQLGGGVKGVIQCAGVLQDCVFDSMTQDQWDEVMKPKVQGTQNLVAAFTPANTPLPALPWFLFLSSAAGVIGNRGQANYAAANTWQDAFALALRTHGICATALAFGPVMGPGMIARNPEVMRALKANGFFGIRHDDFLRCVRIAVASGDALPAHMAFGLGSGGLQRQMKTADPYWLDTAIYRHLALVDVNTDNNDIATENDATQGTSKKARLNLGSVESVQQAIVEALAERLEIAPGSIDVERSMLAYGLDSFSGFWLRKWVEDNMGIEILVFEIIGDVTLAALAQNVVRRWQSLQETKG